MSAPPFALTLPKGFPDDVFETIKMRIVPRIRNPSPELDNLCGAHNAVRFRLRACGDYSDEFVASVRRFGDAGSMKQRYEQERQLFGFFVSGISALDSFYFFLYIAAAHLEPRTFPINRPEDLRNITRKSTADAFARTFSDDSLALALTSVQRDPAHKTWGGFRNVLAHRSAPGRNIYASFGGDSTAPKADWKIDPALAIKIDENLTPSRLTWLVQSLANLIAAADDFTARRF